MTVSTLLNDLQSLGVVLTVTGNKLSYKAPKDTFTPELKAALKEHKAEMMLLLALPTPASPGEELEQLRHAIAEQALAEEAHWELSDELDPRWPPSLGIRKRLSTKEVELWE